MSKGERRRELDGVRGIAILLVLLGHADYRLAPLAAAGVALFFTLSGYLITGLLMAERERTGGLRLRRFYARRFTRLAPPLFVMLAVMGPLLGSTWQQMVLPAAWLTNYAELLGGDVAIYFGHTWSLAVEEQFYLLWPFAFLFLVRRRSGTRVLARVMVVLVAWWFLQIVSGQVEYAYIALETSGVPILGGCLVALRGKRTPRYRAAEALFALLALSGTLAAVSGETSWSAVPIFAVPMTIALVSAASDGRWLAWRPLGFTGVTSYSLYLWHIPVAWAVGGGRITPLGIAAGAGVGLVAYTVVEAPVMHWRARRWAGLDGRRAARSANRPAHQAST